MLIGLRSRVQFNMIEYYFFEGEIADWRGSIYGTRCGLPNRPFMTFLTKSTAVEFNVHLPIWMYLLLYFVFTKCRSSLFDTGLLYIPAHQRMIPKQVVTMHNNYCLPIIAYSHDTSEYTHAQWPDSRLKLFKRVNWDLVLYSSLYKSTKTEFPLFL